MDQSKIMDMFDTYNSWVFDTRLVAHIGNSVQGLQKTSKLAKQMKGRCASGKQTSKTNEVQMCVRSVVQVAAQAVGVVALHLPLGLV